MGAKERISNESFDAYLAYVAPKKKLREKANRGMTVFFVCCLVVGIAVGFFIGKGIGSGTLNLSIQPPFPVKENWEFIYILALFLFYYITVVLHTAIHEAGHLVFGLFSGYRFLSYRIFSFAWVKKDGKTVLKKRKVPGTLGQCLMYPPEWDDNRPYPYVLLNLGGGIFNIIACLLAVPFFFLKSPLLAWATGVFLFTGVIFAISNMIPMTMGVSNDGKNCLLCKKSKDNQKAFYLQLKMNADLSDGAVFADFSEEMFLPGDEVEVSNSLTCYMRLQKFYWHLLRGEKEAAEEALSSMEACMEKLPTGFVNSIDLERMYCLMSERAPLEQIAAHYAVLMPVFQQVKDVSVLRVKYAYYLLLEEEERETIEWLARSKKKRLPKKLPKREPLTAEKIYEEIEKVVKKHPVAGEAKLHMELIQRVQETFEKKNRACETIEVE